MSEVKSSHPLLILGMHRSGTSMVTRLLNLCGLHLGDPGRLMPPHPDNPQGYWENLDLVSLNDRILARMNGAWDLPPGDAPNLALLEEFRAPAAACITAAAPDEKDSSAEAPGPKAWGWKDPRLSLLLPFWSALLPELQVVVCLRHPLEVAASLTRRNGFSTQLGLHLWQRYNERLEQDLKVLPGIESTVTHYEALLACPEQELRRVTECLGWRVPDQTIAEACASIKPELRRQRQGVQRNQQESLPQGLAPLYRRLCRRAGPYLPDEKIPDAAQLEAMNRQGEAHFEAGNYEAAISTFGQVLSGDPTLLRSRNNLACALWQSGRRDEAVSELSTVLNHDPDDGDATWNLGQLLREQGHLDDATQLLQSYLDRNPTAEDISRELNCWKEAGTIPAS